ncbi:MAG: glycosyltransferase 87 family protein [Minisyncoccia bacterium]
MNRSLLDAPAFWYLLGGGVLAISFFVRAISYHVVTSDYTYFVAKWMSDLSAHGFAAFQTPFADYAPLYLYLLKLISYVPVSSLYSAKTLSLVFDVLTAFFACALLYRLDKVRFTRPRLFFCFCVMLSIPTVLINSSLWGQSDALYGAATMGSVYFLFAERPFAAALAFGVALSFKVQAIFFLPVLAAYLFRRGRLAYLLIAPLVFVLSVIPAWLAGGSFSYWLFIYAKQAGEYTGLNLSSPSIFAFAPASPGAWLSGALFMAGVIAAATAAILAFALGARGFRRPPGYFFDSRLLIIVLCVLAIPYFLPRMHERYFYLADLFSVLYALWRPRRWYLPVLAAGASLLAYMPYLSQFVPALVPYTFDLRIPSAMLIVALLSIGVFLARDTRAAPPAT